MEEKEYCTILSPAITSKYTKYREINAAAVTFPFRARALLGFGDHREHASSNPFPLLTVKLVSGLLLAYSQVREARTLFVRCIDGIL
ncbi:hypothetical protein DEO72_LG8g1416 [Vigna unguiculata]|uniref:Uncharacterized protein n=1 Tax=Vigna unguiculata TaxID=3917 RepID=A0A4D6MS00_VIGUN|nr:hypothetical protein DEO72_LG8g1416 [Vigna unguiculata]